MAVITFHANKINREAGYAFVSPITFDLVPGTMEYTKEQVQVVKDLLPQLVADKVIEIEDDELEVEETKETKEPVKSASSSTVKVAKTV